MKHFILLTVSLTLLATISVEAYNNCALNSNNAKCVKYNVEFVSQSINIVPSFFEVVLKLAVDIFSLTRLSIIKDNNPDNKNAKLGGFIIRSYKSTTSYNTTWSVPSIEISGDHFKNKSFLFSNISPGGKFKTKCDNVTIQLDMEATFSPNANFTKVVMTPLLGKCYVSLTDTFIAGFNLSNWTIDPFFNFIGFYNETIDQLGKKIPPLFAVEIQKSLNVMFNGTSQTQMSLMFPDTPTVNL